MTPEQLKASILQYALQGKLVEQRPEEGTAEELYKQIQIEKQILANEGKIKKSKPLPEILEEDILFDIPESWKWIRLGEIVQIISGVSYDKKDVCKEGVRVLRGGNIQSTLVKTEDDDVFLPMSYYDDSKQVKTGDIIYVASTGSKAVIGKPGFIIDGFPNTLIGAFLRICRPISPKYTDYLKLVFSSEYYRKHIRDLAQGTNINNVKESYVTELALPLPPLEEQHRIVAKIEELLPYVDRYAEAYEKIEQFNAKFPEDMKKSILQYAIQGKLVEQRPEEGTAEELYQQIQEEKQKLIKEGKIKKEKPLAEITEDEIPFDIPETWVWVRFDELAGFYNGDRGKNYPNKSEYVSDGIAWINTGHILPTGFLDVNTMNYITEEKYNSLSGGKIMEGDLVYCLRGATYGKVARIEPFSLGAIASSLMGIRPVIKELREYIYLYLKSPLAKQQLSLYENGSAQQNLAAKDVRKYLVPLPPLGEQKRIIEKANELLLLCERLV